MVNILHISRTMDIGGAEKIVYQLATDLRENFDNVHVASTGGLWEVPLKENNVVHHKILDVESKEPKTVMKNFTLLYRIIRKNKITIIHTHHRMAAFYVRILKKFIPNIRHIYTAHNIFDNKLKMYRYSLEGAEIVAVGDGVKKNVYKDVGVSNVTVIYNAIPLKEDNSKVDDIINTSSIKLGFIGRLSEQKGLLYLIEAMNILKNKPIKLFLAGSGELQNLLEEKVKEFEIKEKVQFLGYRNDTISVINSCDFMVMPSLYEGLPLTLIEYFQHSKTVVATDIPGITEVVQSGKNGILVPAKNSEKLAEAILKLAEDKNLKKRLEEQVKSAYEEKFSYDKFKNSYLKIYREE